MPRYDYRCPDGHEHLDAIYPMGKAPQTIRCPTCGEIATRVYRPPAAIHFKGPGFYATDVKGRVNRRRRPNPGDSLPREFDHDAAKIADAA